MFNQTYHPYQTYQTKYELRTLKDHAGSHGKYDHTRKLVLPIYVGNTVIRDSLFPIFTGFPAFEDEIRDDIQLAVVACLAATGHLRTYRVGDLMRPKGELVQVVEIDQK
jgi:hypothetical protein